MNDTPPSKYDDGAPRDGWLAVRRGASKKCPACGKKTLFAGYLKLADKCAGCGEDFTGQRADDAPPYFTLLITGHLIGIPMVESVRQLDVGTGPLLLFWLTAAMTLTFWLLPVTKGGLVGFQWANRMHGFGDDEQDNASWAE